MTKRLLSLFAALSFTVSCAAFAQDDHNPWQSRYQHQGPEVDVPRAMMESAAGLTLPMWSSTLVSFSRYQPDGSYVCDGRRPCLPWTLLLLGRAPQDPGPPPDNVTYIPTRIVPLKIQFLAEDGRTVRYNFDPAQNNGCTPEGTTPLSLTEESPLFKDTEIAPPYWNIFYDHPQEKTQFVDAQMRSEFFNWMPAENPWHNKFKLDDNDSGTVLQVPFGKWSAKDPVRGGCGKVGAIDDKWLDPQLRRIFDNNFVPTTYVVFLTSNVIEYDTRPESDYLGYHDAYQNPPKVYAIAPFDTTKYGGMIDVNVLAHELGETMNNPLVTTRGNRTPGWWNGTECQGNFEVGDPEDVHKKVQAVTMPNGFTYHVQELAFVGWFYRVDNLGIPDPGHEEPYSTNGTFREDAGTACVRAQ